MLIREEINGDLPEITLVNEEAFERPGEALAVNALRSAEMYR